MRTVVRAFSIAGPDKSWYSPAAARSLTVRTPTLKKKKKKQYVCFVWMCRIENRIMVLHNKPQCEIVRDLNCIARTGDDSRKIESFGWTCCLICCSLCCNLLYWAAANIWETSRCGLRLRFARRLFLLFLRLRSCGFKFRVTLWNT